MDEIVSPVWIGRYYCDGVSKPRLFLYYEVRVGMCITKAQGTHPNMYADINVRAECQNETLSLTALFTNLR